MLQVAQTQRDFYREFLMGRGKFDPHDFGANVTREEFTDQMAEEFNGTYRGNWTIDELLLHPREAIRFCDDVRHRHGWYDMPDDLILRVILARRKSP